MIEPGNTAFVAGWGYTDAIRTRPSQLQSVRLKIMDKYQYVYIYEFREELDYVGSTDQHKIKATAEGDSGGLPGGPLIVNQRLAGVSLSVEEIRRTSEDHHNLYTAMFHTSGSGSIAS